MSHRKRYDAARSPVQSGTWVSPCTTRSPLTGNSGPRDSCRVSPIVPHFELDEDDADAGAHLVSLRGEIHVTTAPQLAEHLTDAI